MLIKHHSVKDLIQTTRFLGVNCLALVLLLLSSPSWSDEGSDDNESDDSSGKNYHVILADGMSDLYSEGLRTWLSSHDEKDEMSVLITLKDTPLSAINARPKILSYNIDDTGNIYIEKDGVEISKKEAEDDSAQERQEISRVHIEHEQTIDTLASEVLARLGWSLNDLQQVDGRIVKILSKADILTLENAEDLLGSVEIYSTYNDSGFIVNSLKSAFDSIGLTKWGHDFLGWANIDWRKYGYSINPVGQTSGKGIYIYMQEANNACVPWSYQQQRSSYYRNIHTTNNKNNAQKDITHAKFVLSILHKAAPNAMIYCGDDTMFRIMKAIPKGSVPPSVTGYDIINVTWGRKPSTPLSPYDVSDYRSDELLYNKRISAIVAASGNQPKYTSVPTPANAYNSITVGTYNHRDNKLSSAAVFKNNKTQVEKPEVVAPGVNICIPFEQYVTTSVFSSYCIKGTALSGSSLSAPIVTGIIANLLERYSWLKGQPTRVKSMILAGASQKILLANGTIATTSEVGAGGVDFYTSGFNGLVASFYGFFNNKNNTGLKKDLFEVDFGRTDMRRGSVVKNQKTVRYIDYDMTQRPLTVGTKYRVAMSWLVPPRKGTLINQSGVTHDFDMEIFHKNTNINYGKSEGKNSAYELLEFTAQKSGVLTVRIYNPPTGREKNTDKQDISVALFPVYNHTN